MVCFSDFSDDILRYVMKFVCENIEIGSITFPCLYQEESWFCLCNCKASIVFILLQM